MRRKYMETEREAVARLGRLGYREALRPRPGGWLLSEGHGALAPEHLVIDEIVRFEGASDPGDEAVLFALRSSDGSVAGLFIAGFGSQVDPDSAAAIQRLRHARGPRRTPRGSGG